MISLFLSRIREFKFIIKNQSFLYLANQRLFSLPGKSERISLPGKSNRVFLLSFLYLKNQIEFSLPDKSDRVFSTWKNQTEFSLPSKSNRVFLYLANQTEFSLPSKSDRVFSTWKIRHFSLPDKLDSFLYLTNWTECLRVFFTWQMATKCQRPSVKSGSSTLVTRNSFLATVATARQPLGSTNASRPPAPLPVYRLYSCRRCCCVGVTVAVVYTGSSRSQQAKVKPRTGPPAAQSAILGTEMQSVVSWPTRR